MLEPQRSSRTSNLVCVLLYEKKRIRESAPFHRHCTYIWYIVMHIILSYIYKGHARAGKRYGDVIVINKVARDKVWGISLRSNACGTGSLGRRILSTVLFFLLIFLSSNFRRSPFTRLLDCPKCKRSYRRRTLYLSVPIVILSCAHRQRTLSLSLSLVY